MPRFKIGCSLVRYNWFLLLVAFNIHLSSQAQSDSDEGLPKESDLYQVKLPDFPISNQLSVSYHLTLPSTQKLNPGAPSFLAVYERATKKDKWELTEKLSLKNQIWSGQDLQLSHRVQLKSANSEVAIYSTVIHCGKDGKTGCFIQGFKGKTVRSERVPATKNTVPFYIDATVY